MTEHRDWLPPDFVHPERVELPTGHHLRPIRESDVDIDYPAVMGSLDHLWAIFGEPWGWPEADMTYEDDQRELARHEREIVAHESFNYAVLDAALAGFVPQWITDAWPFERARFIGRDLTWRDWLALPDAGDNEAPNGSD